MSACPPSIPTQELAAEFEHLTLITNRKQSFECHLGSSERRVGGDHGNQVCFARVVELSSQTGVTDPGMKPGTGNLTVPPATRKRHLHT